MQWHCAALVPDHSGGPVPVLHRVPFSSTFVESENEYKIQGKYYDVNQVLLLKSLFLKPLKPQQHFRFYLILPGLIEI